MTPDRAEKFLERARRGDRRAFERLVEPLWPKLYGLALRLAGSPEDAADALQEALLRAWLALPGFRSDARFSTWLYRVVVNAAHDQRERRARLVPTESVEEEAADPRDPALAGELAAALAALEPEFRGAVVLCDVLGLSYAEAAEALDVPEGTVKSRLFRGRRALAGTLGGAAESK